MHNPWYHLLSPLSLATDVTDVTLGESGLWLGTRTGSDGTTTLDRSPGLHGQHAVILITINRHPFFTADSLSKSTG